MADQYDDGRYDGIPVDDMNPGYQATLADTSIGRLPITAPRGGIRYTYAKDSPMAGKTTAVNSEALSIAAAAKRVAGEQLIEEANELDKQAAAIRRPAPPADQDRWAIDVRFNNGGSLYQFLVLRVGKRFYTTGTGENGVFLSWQAFLRWLDENVAEHSALIPLVSDYQTPAPLEGKGR